MERPRANRLIHETSPYLRQHAHNPVDWYAWGEEALRQSREFQKPIFLSIGYSSCHWCHVMEHESFEDAETAKVMNELFINIKVDREERPDLDHIYMTAVQLMTRHGGWPMSVFLTPTLKPFYGGTYFPPNDRMGMPGFRKILLGVSNAWNTNRTGLEKSADDLSTVIAQMNSTHAVPDAPQKIGSEVVQRAIESIHQSFDSVHGGFGSAPKFFHTMDLKLALRHARRSQNADSLNIVKTTLDHWAKGGIYDQLGGGFHRYSTDQEWLVPHFEKMLYDNALLVDAFIEGYQVTRDVEYARIAQETLSYVLREMTAPEGGFYSAQDADSEGVEGKFYVWTEEEITAALGQDLAPAFCKVFNVTSNGNFEGNNILHRTGALAQVAEELSLDLQTLEDSISTARRKLLALRSQRIAPFRDEKRLLAWNALMIHSMALGYQIFGNPTYLDEATKAAEFILKNCWNEEPDSLLHRTYKDGKAGPTAFLDDYANFIFSLVTLYESTFDSRWLNLAETFTRQMLGHYYDKLKFDFYFSAGKSQDLIVRPKEVHDGATPSGTSMAVSALVRLGKILGNASYLEIAEKYLAGAHAAISERPAGMSQLLLAHSALTDDCWEIVLFAGESGEEFESTLQMVRAQFLPDRVLVAIPASSTSSSLALAHGKRAQSGQVTLYPCLQGRCEQPVVGIENIAEWVRSQA